MLSCSIEHGVSSPHRLPLGSSHYAPAAAAAYTLCDGEAYGKLSSYRRLHRYTHLLMTLASGRAGFTVSVGIEQKKNLQVGFLEEI